MPGLLDFLNTDDVKLGIALLSAAGPSMQPMGFGQRLQGAMQSLDADKKQSLAMGLLKAQTDDATQQVELRKQQAAQIQRRSEMVNGLLGQLDAATPAANASVIGQTGNLAPTNANAALQTQALSQLTANNPLSGIPRSAIAFDLATNDGKNIGEWMFKRGVPDMQVSNNYAYDKNTIKPGFLPGVNIANDGRGTLTMPGADGMPRMSALPGSPEAFRQFEDQKNASAAGTDLVKVIGPDGAERYVPKATVLGQQPAQPDRPRVDLSAGDAGRNAILNQELAQARQRLATAATQDERNRASGDIAALQREIGGSAGGFQATPTSAQAATSEAIRTKAVKTAEADVKRDTDRTQEAKLFKQMTAGVDRAIGLLQQGPTQSGAGALYDSAANFVGKSTKGADLAAQLDVIGGFLTSNVPRMEGPQSDKDVLQYRAMAAAVADRNKPVSQRLAAAQELRALQNKYAELNGYAPQGEWENGNAPKPLPLPANPTASSLTKGQFYQLPDGRTGEWDGMRFKVRK